ncbi:MAG: OmpA family protein [Spirosomataceae bacterium]
MIVFRVLVVWILTAGLFAEVYAQTSLLQRANRQQELFSYPEAITLYQEALKTNLTAVEKLQTQLNLAYCYKQIRDTQHAEQLYRAIFDSGQEFTNEDIKVYLHYAQVLASNGKHTESQAVWEKYSKLQADDQRGKNFAKLYQQVGKLNENAGSYQVEYLNLNTNKADFSPVYYKNGLVFVSGRGEGVGIKRIFNWNKSAFLDLYFLPDLSQITATKAGGLGASDPNLSSSRNGRNLGSDEYTAPTANDSYTVGIYGGDQVTDGQGYGTKPVSESERFSQSLNTKYHEGPATFTPDGRRIIFTRNNFNNGSYRESSDKINKLKLYTADEQNGVWANIQELPFNSDEFSVGHPSMTKDGKVMYFVSDMPGGFGGTDVYSVTYDNGKWGQPVNLGKTVNSKGNEMFPFVDEYGNLYFSSDGHSGLGDLDIFFVEIRDVKPIGKIMNLGAPINSPKDDFGIITDGDRKTGYFSSNRKKGGADDDIYRFSRTGALYACRELTVAVSDAQTSTILDSAKVTITLKGGTKTPKEADKNNLFSICLDENKDYTLSAERKGYVPNTIGYSTRGNADDMPSRIEITLTPISVVMAQQQAEQAAKANEPKQPAVKPEVKPQQEAKKISKFRGKIFAEYDKQPLEGVVVTFRNECDGSVQRDVTGKDGIYEFWMVGGCDYTLEAVKENYGRNVNKIKKIPKRKIPEVVDVNLGLLKEGDVIPIDNIYYDFNKSSLRSEGTRELDKLAATLKRYSSIQIEIGSHTDSRGDAEANRQLSQKRAQAVVDYLAKKGINRKRMTATGYGESQLVNECADGVACTEAEHQKNRRTTLKVIRLN